MPSRSHGLLALTLVATLAVGCARLGPRGAPIGSDGSSQDAGRDLGRDRGGALDLDAAPGELRVDLPSGEGAPPFALQPVVSQTSVYEGTAIVPVDVNNALTGDDSTTDGVALSYSCRFDKAIDGQVASNATSCDSLVGASFGATSGKLTWEVPLGQIGRYELAITASAAARQSSVLFEIAVVVDDRPTGLAVGETRRVSVGPQGAQANSASNGHTVGLSANGRFVIYSSRASNLVVGDSNMVADTFVTDVRTLETWRVSVSNSGVEGDGASDGSAIGGAVSGLAISDDGYVVAFISAATNLVPSDNNGKVDVFVRDRCSGKLQRVSRSTFNAEANGHSQRAQLSGDGRMVVFQSSATNLDGADLNGVDDCFVHDRQSGVTLLVPRLSGGGQLDAACQHPRISADGTKIAFYSSATNAVTGDTNGKRDAFVTDLAAASTIIVSRTANGTLGDDHMYSPGFSADGKYVSFHGHAKNLVAGDTNGEEDVYQVRLSDGALIRVSESGHPAALQSDGRSYVSRQSLDGRFVSFNSVATNLFVGKAITNGLMDVYVKDTQSGQVFWASRGLAGALGDGRSDRAYISRDGTHVAFESSSTNLVTGDTNGVVDIFVHRFR